MSGIVRPNQQQWRLTNCCFCINLETGCRLIATFTAFVCSIQLFEACGKLIGLLEKEKNCLNGNRWMKEEHQVYYSNCSHIKVVQFVLILDFILFMIGLNGSILLLYGIRSKQPKLFLAWFIFAGMMVMSNLFSLIVFHNKDIPNNLLRVVLFVYFFRVIRSYYLQLYTESLGGLSLEDGSAISSNLDGVRSFVGPSAATSYPTYPLEPPQGRMLPSEVKEEPPPPYPGLPTSRSANSVESQPPPYSLVAPNMEYSDANLMNYNRSMNLNVRSENSEVGGASSDVPSSPVVEFTTPRSSMESDGISIPFEVVDTTNSDLNDHSDHLQDTASPHCSVQNTEEHSQENTESEKTQASQKQNNEHSEKQPVKNEQKEKTEEP